jgi:RHS repeat-associated protein
VIPATIGTSHSNKERDTESGNDYFLARYYNSNTGRFLSPDWSVKIQPVPYANLYDPQSLNLYSYVLNNPLNRVDADGHCSGVNCKKVKVTAKVIQRASIIKNDEVKGKQYTGPGGIVEDTVKRNGKVVDGVHVTEQNTTTQTINGKTTMDPNPIPGSGDTKDGGKIDDLKANMQPTDGSPAKNEAISLEYGSTPLRVVDQQIITLTFPGPQGGTCQAAMTTVLQNYGASPNIISSYSLTITSQPVVTSPSP